MHSPQHSRRPFGQQQSPDAAMQQAGTSLSEWGRYLDENHDLAIGVLDDLVTNIVGTGIHIEPQPVVGGRENRDLAEQINDEFMRWCRRPEVTGELPWAELQRLGCRSWLRDGEFFAQHVGALAPYPWADGEVRYRVEFLESAMVPLLPYGAGPATTPDAAMAGARQGVFLNEWNQPTGYVVYLRHPHDYTVSTVATGLAGDLTRTKVVPAIGMMHVKFVRRWPQTRGVPILHGVIRRMQDIKHYEDSERIAARVAADMCAYIRKSADNVYETTDGTFDNRPERMQAGRIFDDLLPGEEIGTISHDRPNAGLGEYRSQMLKAVAAGTGTRYSSIAKDYDGSYSAQRQETVETRPHYLRLRHYFVEKFVRPVYESWLQQAWLQGVLTVPPAVLFEDLRKAEYIGPGMPWIDPMKEVQADALAVENGFVTREQVIINRGGDPRQVPAPSTPVTEPATVLEVVDDDEEDPADTGTA